MLRDPADFATPAPEPIRQVQQAVLKADHLVVVYPLWLGTMPALVKAFFEHFARAEFAIGQSEQGWPRKMLKGRSARVVVTRGISVTSRRSQPVFRIKRRSVSESSVAPMRTKSGANHQSGMISQPVSSVRPIAFAQWSG